MTLSFRHEGFSMDHELNLPHKSNIQMEMILSLSLE